MSILSPLCDGHPMVQLSTSDCKLYLRSWRGLEQLKGILDLES